MYKDRMKKWGLAKYIKEHEAVAILRMTSERAAQGKTTSIVLNNQTVDLDRFLRHAGRCPIERRLLKRLAKHHAADDQVVKRFGKRPSAHQV